ncbi:carbon-nitrogen hydrolase family protein [Paracoccus sp. p4-l81]|uniref:carbon-nitrogen hydrolase family protein n=1 Tax=Paracoccus sp. p4-l81 TaxID=3342806 RepID=UPI0035B7273E
MTIAAAAYPLDWFDDWSDYEAKLTAWVEAAVSSWPECPAGGSVPPARNPSGAPPAQLLVFPEYGAMELASLAGRPAASDLEASLRAVADLEPARAALHDRLARQHGIHILAASGPVFTGARPVNRATLYGPNGPIGHQDKQIMTRFEREDWDVTADPASGLALFDTALGKIGVLICYDSEFPALGRALTEAGAQIILCPSCTDSIAGFTRVRIGAMARALEGQCVTVQSPTVRPVDWNPAIDENRGAAAIYGPPDRGWPETGVLAEGKLDEPGWVIATVDLDLVAQSRADGAVLPFAHHPESAASAARGVRIVKMP